MATVYEEAKGAISSGTTLTLTGVDVAKDDYLVAVLASYQNVASYMYTSGGDTLGLNYGLTITATSPDLRVYFYINSGAAIAQTGGTLTYTQPSSGEAVIVLYRISPREGYTISLRSFTANQTSGTTSSITSNPSVPIVEETIVLGLCGVADDTFFTDTDTTNGSWSSVYFQGNTTGDDIGAFGQYKISTGVGQQTWNGTWANAGSETAYPGLFTLYEIGRPYWGMEAF